MHAALKANGLDVRDVQTLDGGTMDSLARLQAQRGVPRDLIDEMMLAADGEAEPQETERADIEEASVAAAQ